MKKGTKIFVAALALVIVFGAVVGGTLAWLMDTTDTIENVFTVGNVDISLAETKGNFNGGTGKTEFKMIPGANIEKDPKVTVEVGSEASWVFVKIEDDNNDLPNGEKIVKYTKASGWSELKINDETVEGVYYRESPDLSDALITPNPEVYDVFAGNTVLINGDIEMDMFTGNNDPELSITAYACQKQGLSVEQAWAELNA